VPERPQLACEKEPERFFAERDNRKTRALCNGVPGRRPPCFKRVECAIIAVAFVESSGHPVGTWAGVFLPNDQNHSNDNKTTVLSPKREGLRQRRQAAITQLREIAASQSVADTQGKCAGGDLRSSA
jgi:hypothetical protein